MILNRENSQFTGTIVPEVAAVHENGQQRQSLRERANRLPTREQLSQRTRELREAASKVVTLGTKIVEEKR